MGHRPYRLCQHEFSLCHLPFLASYRHSSLFVLYVPHKWPGVKEKLPRLAHAGFPGGEVAERADELADLVVGGLDADRQKAV